jgi:hypothetical protein
MWWARDFGRLLEPDMGKARYAAFVAGTAIVASGWQLLTTAATGIGFSGVVYAMFGYGLARRGSRPAYAAFVTPGTIRWMLGWLVLCIVLTVSGTWTVGNAAHVSGLASGWLLGVALERRRWRPLALAGMAVLVAGTVLSVAYMPWSTMWRARSAYYAFDEVRRRAEGGDAQAKAAYGSTLMRWPEQRTTGLDLLRQSAQAGDTDGMNALAWWLATAREDNLRNGAEAVDWAEKARAAAPSANAEDTLAAAYAEVDRWDDALAAEKRALAGDADEAQKKHIQDHLALYERREKVRE